MVVLNHQYILNVLANNSSIIHLSTILILFIITYCRILGKDYYWLIDDLEGIAKFSETWNDKDQKKIDSYEVVPGKTVKYLSFIPELGFPGCVLRFLRLHIGKKFKVIGKNSKGHEVWVYVQSPRRHHVLSMVVQSLNLVLGYTFLKAIVPEPIAFATCLLYSVHPLTTQAVAWISGINYSLSMLFSLMLLNVCLFFHVPELRFIVIGFLSFSSTVVLYTGGLTFIPIWFLGFHLEALIAGLVGVGVLIWKGIETKNYRTNAFKEQNMAAGTQINFRKPLVMLKTLWYYMGLVWLPLSMGLYHIWGYFYDELVERFDWMVVAGILTLSCFVLGFLYGDFAIRIGIVWFFTYFAIFSNFITAQQFVADRYIMTASFGTCLILASLLYGTPFFWIILGLYTMRTFLHLPTFKNEVDFYLSNWLNFRKSEVCLGNLGVAYINQGMHGSGVDVWFLASKINPLYDVPWYNLYSVFKSNGKLAEAKDFLQKCLNAKVVHFEDRWTKEMEELNKILEAQKKPPTPTEMNYHQAADHYAKKEHDKELMCLEKFMVSDTSNVIPEMIQQVKQRIAEIKSGNLGGGSMPRHPESPVIATPPVGEVTVIPPKRN